MTSELVVVGIHAQREVIAEALSARSSASSQISAQPLMRWNEKNGDTGTVYSVSKTCSFAKNMTCVVKEWYRE